MSKTEKEAIEAGNVGWEKDLFQGKPNWKNLAAAPTSSLSQEEKHFIENEVESLCSLLDDWKIVQEQSDLSKETWEFIKKSKLFGMIIPKEYGGLGFSVRAHSEIITKIATRSITAAVTVMVPNSLGPAELLLHYGTDEQKQYYLPRLAEGIDIPCFALTSTEAGSDAGSMIDKGIVCTGVFDGKEVLGIQLTFEKRYITLAPVATLVGVAFKLYDPSLLLGKQKDIGITLALIPVGLKGLHIGERHFPLNLAFMNGPMHAEELFIPLDYIIGGEKMAGQGWRMLMECLSAGRGISLPALSTATGILSSKMTSAYAAIRQQFKLPIAKFEGIEEALARIIGNTYLLQACRLFTVDSIDQYKRPSVATAIAKYHMTELSRQVINDAMDIHGGRGIMLGPKNYLARGYQAMPVSITVEGANILTRNLMIFGQGAIRCHPYARDEMAAAELYEKDPDAATKQFDALLVSHILYFMKNIFYGLWLSLTRGFFVYTGASDVTKPFLKKLTWLSVGLALTSDLSLMILGGSLKRRERLSARLGDVLSELYLASAVVKYFIDRGKPKSDEPVVKWALQLCCYRAQEAYYGFFDNVNSIILGKILKRWIFSLGKVFNPPSDKLSHQVVKTFYEDNNLRDSLTALCYIGKDQKDPVGLMETTYKMINSVLPIQQKLHESVKNHVIPRDLPFEQKVHQAVTKKVLTEQEGKLLSEFEALRIEAIRVDAFPAHYSLGSKGK
jgi:acyl-CoA dehydrogenase